MKIKLMRNCFIDGDLHKSGTVVDIDDKTAKYLIATEKAAQVKDADTGKPAGGKPDGGKPADKENEK